MTTTSDRTLTPSEFRAIAEAIQREVAKVIVGQTEVVRSVLVALISGGHVLLEGVPGLGKTMLVRTLAETLDLHFSRIQFTPDLMPSDIIGTNIIVEDDHGRRSFRFQAGPVFANLVLADEINRATPKTQSALLEAMQEHTVTVSTAVHRLPEPFFVLATQNPIEMEGTYPLPEAQLDRFFFKLQVSYPPANELAEILDRTTSAAHVVVEKVANGALVEQMGALAREVPIARHVREYAVRLVLATHPDQPGAPPVVRQYVRYGASPRGAQAMILAAKVLALLDGRFNVAFDDLRQVALPALRHRIILNFQAEAEGLTTDRVLAEIVRAVPEE
ncbi:MAG: MoxR family ATPase [Chloroflexota bacterium]|nr:MoxR family ATPase [Dehalococcoidia bacterium]MDW8252725.1 MoxR family ATPase [Chloroflexota bacterium]